MRQEVYYYDGPLPLPKDLEITQLPKVNAEFALKQFNIKWLNQPKSNKVKLPALIITPNKECGYILLLGESVKQDDIVFYYMGKVISLAEAKKTPYAEYRLLTEHGFLIDAQSEGGAGRFAHDSMDEKELKSRIRFKSEAPQPATSNLKMFSTDKGSAIAKAIRNCDKGEVITFNYFGHDFWIDKGILERKSGKEKIAHPVILDRYGQTIDKQFYDVIKAIVIGITAEAAIYKEENFAISDYSLSYFIFAEEVFIDHQAVSEKMRKDREWLIFAEAKKITYTVLNKLGEECFTAGQELFEKKDHPRALIHFNQSEHYFKLTENKLNKASQASASSSFLFLKAQLHLNYVNTIYYQIYTRFLTGESPLNLNALVKTANSYLDKADLSNAPPEHITKFLAVRNQLAQLQGKMLNKMMQQFGIGMKNK